MLKIVKYGCEFNVPKKCLGTLECAYDGIRVRLCDNTEINFPMTVSPQLKALIPIIKAANTENITVLNLDNALMGKYDSIVSMESKIAVVENPPIIEYRIKPEDDEKTKTKTVKKTRGRPSSKKN